MSELENWVILRQAKAYPRPLNPAGKHARCHADTERSRLLERATCEASHQNGSLHCPFKQTDALVLPLIGFNKNCAEVILAKNCSHLLDMGDCRRLPAKPSFRSALAHTEFASDKFRARSGVPSSKELCSPRANPKNLDTHQPRLFP